LEEIDEELAALLDDDDIDAPKKVEKDVGTINHYSKYTRAVFIENVISPADNSEVNSNSGDKSIKASDNV
jgi:hypothetical protein